MQTEEQLLSGWGRTAPSLATVHHVAAPSDVDEALARPGERGTVARGLGRSYGDAAQNAGGTVVETTAMRSVHEVDLQRGAVTVDAGASIDLLLRALIPLGWFVPVTPGTRQVTVGGAIAADIHGKNHHREGSFCDHVERFTLRTPTAVLAVEPGEDVFAATAGGMGLTGIVTEATFRLLPVETAFVRVDTERATDLDDCMSRMSSGDHRYRYSVAWIDLLAGGAALGRSVLTRGDHATADEVRAAGEDDPILFSPSSRLAAPPWVPSGLLNIASIRAFNELWFRNAPVHREGEIQSVSAFFHPLDAVAHWNRLYGRHGFVQYQFVVPFGEERTLRSIVTRLSEEQVPSFLAVLKRFGEGNDGHLSFPMAGWTLALDIPAAVAGLGRLLDDLDEDVVAAGGRVYLAKDARLRPELLPAMYPRLDEWRAVRDRLDPERKLRSDLARRLELV